MSDSRHVGRPLHRTWRLTVAENDPLELALLRGAGKNCLLDGVGGSKTENEHRLRLANAVCAIHRLQIAGGPGNWSAKSSSLARNIGARTFVDSSPSQR